MPESGGQRAIGSRALGALYGLAIGDALGMPTESRSRPDIVARYGDLLGAFEPGPPDHPLAAGLPAGTVTDDTEQTVLLARLIVEHRGDIGPAELASRLLAWEDSMRARGSLSLLGPSTKRALGAILAGASIEDAGRFGTTNGAAMRITPVGVATPSGDRDLLVDRVVAASRVTHNTGIALAGAAAVAAAVSAGIDGATVPDAVRIGAAAAASAAQRGHWAAGADVGSRITWAAGLVTGLGLAEAMDVVYRVVGTSLATQESVAAAFAVSAASPDDPWLACRIAASLGGDCDTIAAMTGAICGACHGVEAFPASVRSTVARVNNLGLEALAGDLLAVRAGAGTRASRRADPGRATMRQGDQSLPAGVPSRFDRILHLGNVVVDVVLSVPALPERGSDVVASRAEATAGGGFNVMAAAARQGLRAAYAGAHGTGPFGTLARSALAQEGIEVIQPVKTGLDTGFVLTIVEASGERTFLTSPGAEATVTLADLDPIHPAPRDALYLSGYSLVHASNRAALLGWLARLGDDHTMFFDPGPLVGSIPAGELAAVLGRADWLTCNAREAAIMTGSDPWAAVTALISRTSRRSRVLVRTGPDGCLIGRPDARVVHVPGFSVRVVDTNGAGDTHSGAFIAALAAGAAEAAAARSANAAAALSVTRPGPATAPTREELAHFLATA